MEKTLQEIYLKSHKPKL